MSMHELTRVNLDNEMDLILAHKRSMKLAEISGLSLSAQTTFATAVSEVARTSIESKKSSFLTLNIELQKRDKFIVASLNLHQTSANEGSMGLEYAKKLVAKYNISKREKDTVVELFYYIQPNFKIDTLKLDEWRSLFRNEPPVSPYEELKRKNDQLQDLSDKIQKSEAQYRSLTNTLPLFIFTISAEGEIVYANRWLTSFTGENLTSLNRSQWKNVIHPDDYSGFSVILQKDITRAISTLTIQARIRNVDDNEYYWHQLVISPSKDDRGNVLSWTGYIADIHSQKEYEQTLKDNVELKVTQDKLEHYQRELEQNIEELNRSNEELQQFAFVASHDLQEPVRKIIYYSDYLIQHGRNRLSEKDLNYLNIVHSSSLRMRGLIRDLLSYSQVEKNNIRFSEVDLNEIVKSSIREFDILISEKTASVTIGALPDIYGDERMFRQLFDNLLSNALKFSKPERPPVVSVFAEESDNVWKIVVEDNGVGFDEQYLSKIFTLFQRLHDKQSYAGTGIGLAICKKIVEAHNGNIWASSVEGSGTRFFIELPKRNEQIA
ncbi:sensor histidine kinase [Pollutibacter soli]|uniref:sensor histidine kinase n=1 Tax=Pollutibacter soli TaxID=3034157 RepID=UPI00301331BB